MKRLTARTSMIPHGPRPPLGASEASPCFAWKCYPEVSQVIRRQN
jgi:hypothetical protein